MASDADMANHTRAIRDLSRMVHDMTRVLKDTNKVLAQINHQLKPQVIWTVPGTTPPEENDGKTVE
jgi:hypothetical protein